MSITKVQFADKSRGWSLNETSFTDFNLLVGKSGVGKTNVLNALRTIRNAGTHQSLCPNGCEWEIEIEADGTTYVWQAKTSFIEGISRSNWQIDPKNTDENDAQMSSRNSIFIFERIWKSDTNDLIVERTPEKFQFNNTTLPKLNNDTCALSLLHEEESIAPIYTALLRIQFSEALEGHRPWGNVRFDSFDSNDSEALDGLKKHYYNLEALREATEFHFPVLMKGLILQKVYKDEFARIKEDYISIFPTVTDIRIGSVKDFEPEVQSNSSYSILTIAIKEDGVDGWIMRPSLSSGMQRTLFHLLELALAPNGTVMVIDELENSLGVNCLDEIVHALSCRSREIQVIATSHHPYVINAVPPEQWRLVTRKGSVITVKDMNSIPALKSRSNQDNFIRLINLAEYEEGIR